MKAVDLFCGCGGMSLGFESQGYEILEESIRKKENGNILSAYLKDEIGGFAVHIIEK